MDNNDSNKCRSASTAADGKGRRIVVDVWTVILSFLPVTELGNMISLCSNDIKNSLELTQCHVELMDSSRFKKENWWRGLAACIVKYLPQTRRIMLHETSCTTEFLHIIQCWLEESGRVIDFSLTKCFGISNASVSQLLPHCANAVIGDLSLGSWHERTLSQASCLKTLILSNCTIYRTGLLACMLKNIPTNLRLLAMGGVIYSNVASDLGSVYCDRSDLVVECTFWTPSDTEALRRSFPSALLMNLQLDDISHLDLCMDYISSAFDDKKFPFGRELLSCSSRHHFSPLHLACIAADVSRCGWLLRHGARPMSMDGRGCTPLHRATEAYVHAHTQIPSYQGGPSVLGCVRLLLAAGANCFAKNQSTESPLYISCIKGDADSLQAMLEKIRNEELQAGLLPHGMPMSVRRILDHKGYTLLHGAIIGQNINCCTLLLGNFQEDLYSLQLDSGEERESMLEFINLKNAYGVTALDLAERYVKRGTETVDLLKRLGAVTGSSSPDQMSTRDGGRVRSGRRRGGGGRQTQLAHQA